MNLQRIAYISGVVLVIGVTVLSTLRFYLKEKPFYIRLKTKRKRPKYKLKNIRIGENIISGELTTKKSHFTFNLGFLNNGIIHFIVNDPVYPRFVVEDVIVLKTQDLLNISQLNINENNETVHIQYLNFIVTVNCDNLAINIYKNNTLIISINSQNSLSIEEKEPQVGVSTDFLFPLANKAYGLAQHAEKLTLKPTKDKPYRLYNTDRFGYSAKDHYESLYGAVPLIYGFQPLQTAGLLWLNASETFIDIEYKREGLLSTFYSESGALDFYVLTGPSLADCVTQYAQLTGAVPQPPLFALGYHQSRFSYMTQDEVTEVSDSFDEMELPLDAIWLDIDYTDDKKYFTWNTKTYPDPNKLLRFLDNRRRKAVVIIDPHIKIDDEYFVYQQCKKENLFVKNTDGSIFQAKCWPGDSAWIDFFDSKARDFYAGLHQDFAKAPNLQIWDDMNEPALFEVKENAMPKNVVHQAGWKHRDVHNIYGFYQTVATYQGLIMRENLRPFVLTRSHFSGSQRFAAIWTGDNTADWEHLHISIPMCLTASLSGFSLCGADIGGFVKHPTDELLQRWYQLGAWIPFFRGHSNRNVPRREPYLYGEKVQRRIRSALHQRYKHLHYWYTLFWQHYTTLEPVIRPLIYQYPHDEVADVDNQFLVGRDILVCPVMDPQVDKIDVYLPGSELWYYMERLLVYKGRNHVAVSVDLDSIPVFYRGGSIVPIVEKPIKSSGFINSSSISLYIFCDKMGNASGSLYNDDYASFNYLKNNYSYVSFDLKGSKVSSKQINSSNYVNSVNLSSIKLFGFELNVAVAEVEVDNVTEIVNVVKMENSVEILGLDINLGKKFVINLNDS